MPDHAPPPPPAPPFPGSLSPGSSPLDLFDVAIVGAGPAGLFAAFQCRMLRLSCVLLDVLSETGGQCAALYPEKPIFDIPAHPAIEAGTLVSRLEEQLAPFAVPRLLGRRVDSLSGGPGAFSLGTDRGDRVRCRAVIVAAGAGAFGPNRPPLPELDRFERSGAVQYYVRRRADFAGRRVAIAGGGDSAVDWALFLAPVAAKVWLVHRRDRFRAAPESLERLRTAEAAGQVERVVPFQLSALRGDADGILHGLVVSDLDAAERVLDADRLLPCFGLSTELGPLSGWELATTGDRGPIPVDAATLRTARPGVFAIGDVCSYPGKLKLISQGFSEAAMVAHALHAVCRPGEALHFEHSTTAGLPLDAVPA
ncbi:MAG: NAD(P)/FAD-dependent oxidoreductase [Gluconacetobacter diazotrophicus]|nr:NAD(P)/FAD-dependent oxidoreductase [Gluconacetobacter diazotrophicus]